MFSFSSYMLHCKKINAVIKASIVLWGRKNIHLPSIATFFPVVSSDVIWRLICIIPEEKNIYLHNRNPSHHNILTWEKLSPTALSQDRAHVYHVHRATE